MKATVVKSLRQRRELKAVQDAATRVSMIRTQSRVASIHESINSNRVLFSNRAARKVGSEGQDFDIETGGVGSCRDLAVSKLSEWDKLLQGIQVGLHECPVGDEMR